MADLAAGVPRRRLAVLLAVVVVSLAAAGIAVARAASRSGRAERAARTSAPAASLTAAAVAAVPHVVVRSTALGPTYGKVALVPLSRPDGPRAVTDRDCERVYATRTTYLCLSAMRGALTRYAATTLDAQLRPQHQLRIAGSPSRARLSADGRLAAMTVFVAGHSYLDTGFSTVASVDDAASGRRVFDLEQMAIVKDGRRYRSADANFWGITFDRGDPNRFYATLSTRGQTYLVRGDVAARTVTTLHRNVECPSLSPDGTRVAYKKRVGGLRWRLSVLDLATMRETPLAETRSVDDQPEWNGAGDVLYALPRSGGVGTAVTDVWQVRADGSGTPTVLVPQASSPAVVR